MPETRRQRLDALRNTLYNERQSFVQQWKDLTDYVEVRRGRFFSGDRNRGDRRNSNIIDPTATLSARTMRAGMMSGITSPSRPWYVLTTPDPDLAEFGPVKRWLRVVVDRMRAVFLKSNLYQSLPTVYGDEGVFGTAAMMVLEDDDSVIRCPTFPLGSYMIAQSAQWKVDTFVRDYQMTVRQLVEMFGEDNVSTNVRKMHEQSSNLEQWQEIRHVIMPNPEFDPDRLESKYKPWLSIYYETGESDGKFLRESGFDEFPVMAPRWSTNGEDVYGTECPGMTCIGDVKMLQKMHRKKLRALDKMIDPPMNAPTSMANKKLTLLPGDVNFVDVAQGMQGFAPAHQVNFNLEHLRLDINETQLRIGRCFYEDLFMMLAQSDRREITAREVEERHEEKLLMLSPMLERQNEDLLNPLIDRTFAIMLRRGMFPNPPQELQGQELRVEYVSIMAQAQKAVATAGIDRLAGYIGGLAQASGDIGVWDKFDKDQSVDEYGNMVGAPPNIIRTDRETQQIRQARAQQIAQQQQLDSLQQGAETARTLSQTDTSGDNALTRIATTAGAA